MPYNDLIQRADTAGLIPEDRALEIIQEMPASSVALSTFRSVPMARGVTEQPVLSAMPTAYWVGASDTGLKQTADQTWGDVTLTARELAVIVPIPIAVLEDSAVDIWGEVKPRIAEAFGQKIDAAALFGTDSPSGWPDSIVTQALATSPAHSVTVGTGVDIAEDINDVWALVEEDGFDVDVQWARRSIRSRLRGLREATTNAFIFQPPQNTQDHPTILGEEVKYVSNGSWDNTYGLVVGSRNSAIIGLRQDIEYKMFTESVITDDLGAVVLNLMQQDAVALRATMRVGYATANPPTRMNETAASRFPFAVLVE